MTEIRISGPFFDARGSVAIDRFRARALDDVAGQAMADVHENLDRSIKQPTPYYETQIQMQRISALQRRVDDRGVIYGPWLEGVGSRNRTTRFKGYASFRRATQSVRGRVKQLCAPAVALLVRELGG